VLGFVYLLDFTLASILGQLAIDKGYTIPFLIGLRLNDRPQIVHMLNARWLDEGLYELSLIEIDLVYAG
jgi:hypothetical protein